MHSMNGVFESDSGHVWVYGDISGLIQTYIGFGRHGDFALYTYPFIVPQDANVIVSTYAHVARIRV